MDQFDKDEFWKSLTRLYDSSVELRISIEKMNTSIHELRVIAESHENRLDDVEVIQRWLAAKEREREKGEQ